MVLAGIVIWTASCLTVPAWQSLAQPLSFATLFLAASLAAAGTLWWIRRKVSDLATRGALITIALFLGLCYTGAVMNSDARRANDLSPAVAALKERLQDPLQLVSFGPIDHRFAFYYRDLINEWDWPENEQEVPGHVRFFCFEHHRGDTAQVRANGRGMYWGTTSGTLPFAWEEVIRIPCDRNVRDDPEVTVVVGRILEAAGQIAEAKPAGHSSSGSENIE
jgi:hypothetical protein